jgi:hypothetical protein
MQSSPAAPAHRDGRPADAARAPAWAAPGPVERHSRRPGHSAGLGWQAVATQHPPHPVGRQPYATPGGPGQFGGDPGGPKPGCRARRRPPAARPAHWSGSPSAAPAAPAAAGSPGHSGPAAASTDSRSRDGCPSPDTRLGHCRVRPPWRRSVDGTGTAGHPGSRRRALAPRPGRQGKGCVAVQRQWGTCPGVATFRRWDTLACRQAAGVTRLVSNRGRAYAVATEGQGSAKGDRLAPFNAQGVDGTGHDLCAEVTTKAGKGSGGTYSRNGPAGRTRSRKCQRRGHPRAGGKRPRRPPVRR